MWQSVFVRYMHAEQNVSLGKTLCANAHVHVTVWSLGTQKFSQGWQGQKTNKTESSILKKAKTYQAKGF